MSRNFHHFSLWITFVILLPVGFLIEFNLEKGKITGEFLSPSLLIFIEGFVFAIVVYPITFFLLAVLLERFFNNAYAKVLIYCIAGGVMGGLLIYPRIFPSVWEHRYHLNEATAIFVFGAEGLIYSFVDIYSSKKLKLNMRVSKGVKIAVVSLCLASLVVVCYGTYSKYTYNMHTNEHGVFYKKVISPDKSYIAKAYGFPYGGAAGGVSVRIDVIYTKGDFRKTIYYSSLYENFSMRWRDNKTLYIENKTDFAKGPDRSITLNVFKQIYDEKGTACVSLVMKDKYNNCYQY